jgi:hypothetical protein
MRFQFRDRLQCNTLLFQFLRVKIDSGGAPLSRDVPRSVAADSRVSGRENLCGIPVEIGEIL